VNLPRPRNRESDEFAALREEILREFNLMESGLACSRKGSTAKEFRSKRNIIMSTAILENKPTTNRLQDQTLRGIEDQSRPVH